MAILEDSVVINAPVERVFEFMNNIEMEIWLVIKGFDVKIFPMIAG